MNVVDLRFGKRGVRYVAFFAVVVQGGQFAVVCVPSDGRCHLLGFRGRLRLFERSAAARSYLNGVVDGSFQFVAADAWQAVDPSVFAGVTHVAA